MLFNCSVSQTFWIDFKWYWYYNTKEVIRLSLKDIIVGVGGNCYDFLNYCILVGKSVIYHCKRKNVTPSLRNMSKTSASVSSGVPNTEKRMKARGRRPSAFIVSRCLEPLMKHEFLT